MALMGTISLMKMTSFVILKKLTSQNCVTMSRMNLMKTRQLKFPKLYESGWKRKLEVWITFTNMTPHKMRSWGRDQVMEAGPVIPTLLWRTFSPAKWRRLSASTPARDWRGSVGGVL